MVKCSKKENLQKNMFDPKKRKNTANYDIDE